MGICGGGASIFLLDNVSFYICLNVGSRTNTKSEIVAWDLLFFVASLNISIMKVFGDLKFVVDWISSNGHVMVLTLKHWMDHIENLKCLFQNLFFQHILRKWNQ